MRQVLLIASFPFLRNVIALGIFGLALMATACRTGSDLSGEASRATERTATIGLDSVDALDARNASNPLLPLRPAADPSALPNDAMAQAKQAIAAREYWASTTEEGLQAPNRQQNLRSWFLPTGVRVHDRTAADSPRLVELRLAGFGRGEALAQVAEGEIRHEASRVEIAREELGLVEWFENTAEGLEQGFTLSERPEAKGAAPASVSASEHASSPNAADSRRDDDSLVLELAVVGANATLDGDTVRLATQAGRKLAYGKLLVVDAKGTQLASHFEVPSSDRVRLVVDDEKAVYPIEIDPLLTNTFEDYRGPEQFDAQLGQSVASAGDVNGDGFDDVIIGAPFFDNGQTDEGAAFVFLGSAAGIGSGNTAGAHRLLEENFAGGQYGYSVASAGDVNGDGYSDVIVGSPFSGEIFGAEGQAFIYLGSATGIVPGAAHTRMRGGQGGASLGFSVASAGDVNGDGYADVITGAYVYDFNNVDEGAALIYHGSPTGVNGFGPAATRILGGQLSAIFGVSVASAGDVNADGYGDVIVGAHVFDRGQIDEGAAFVYLGSAAGVASAIDPVSTADAVLESNQSGSAFGFSVSSAGDVNGDGHSDVIVGAFNYQLVTAVGAALVFHGGATGIDDGNALTADAGLIGQPDSQFGRSVASAGDINADGYADVVVGAFLHDSGPVDDGAILVYLGGTLGINGLPVAPDFFFGGQTGARLGVSVAAGDFNGDGYDDVIAGAYLHDGAQTDEGRAYVLHGGARGLRQGDPGSGAITVLLGEIGIGVAIEAYDGVAFTGAPAGDVNGDGFGDLIVGVPQYDNAQLDSGAVFIVHGTQTGLQSTPTQVAANTQIYGDQEFGLFGFSVSSAGDVNGDGYGDVIVASRDHDAGETDEGAAFVFLGSASGVASGTPAAAHARLETNQIGAQIHRVSSAGDINADGFGDVLLSSGSYDSGTTDEGAAFLFLGSASGIANANPSTASGRFETDQTLADVRASSAGDLNGDGFGDIVVQSVAFASGEASEGAAFVVLGSSTGIPNTNPTTAHARLETNLPNAGQGSHSFSPGDVNGDGYSDLLVSVPNYHNGQILEGAAFLFHGSSTGLAGRTLAAPDTLIDSNALSGRLRSSASDSPFDVNADGYADLMLRVSIGSTPFTFIFHGSPLGLPSGNLSNAKPPAGYPGESIIPGGDVDGDGQGDFLSVAFVLQQTPPFPVRSFTMTSILGNQNGRDMLARQRRGNGSGISISPGGSSHANQFVAELFLRSPRGREYGKLEVEVCPGATAVFGAPSCIRQTSSTWVDLGTTGAVLSRTISGLADNTPYRWRARGRYAAYQPTPPGVAIRGVEGPWSRVQGRVPAVDFRTPAPEPGIAIALAAGGLLLARLGAGRRVRGHD